MNGCVWRLKLKVKIRHRVIKNVRFWYPCLCVIVKSVLTTLEPVEVATEMDWPSQETEMGFDRRMPE